VCVPPKTSFAWDLKQGGGGWTSVSAPLGIPPQVTVPLGSPTAWIGNPDVRPPEDIIRMEPETGWRGGGPLCPLRWMFHRESPQRWATQPPGSGIPMCVHRETSFGWNQRKGGGGADLCVRSAGYSSEITRTAGQPNRMDRESRCVSLRRHHPKGTGDRVAGGLSGVSDACGSAAHRNGFSPIQTQRSGHRGPPPRDPLCGPWPRGALGAGAAEIPMHAVLAAHRDGGPPMHAQRSGHRGPPPRDPLAGTWPWWSLGVGPAGFSIQVFGLPIGTVSLRSKPSGADTEVRPPATRCAVPGHGGLWGWVQRVFRSMRLVGPAERSPLRFSTRRLAPVGNSLSEFADGESAFSLGLREVTSARSDRWDGRWVWLIRDGR